MKTKTTFHNPITEGVIWKQILLYFFPLLVSSFFQQLYNTADAVIVGQAAGKEALSAVGGSAGSVLGIFLMFYVGFGGGAAVPASQHFGAKNESALRTTLLTFIGICVTRCVWGILIVPFHHTINMVLLSFAVSWAVTSAAFILYYRRYTRKHFL